MTYQQGAINGVPENSYFLTPIIIVPRLCDQLHTGHEWLHIVRRIMQENDRNINIEDDAVYNFAACYIERPSGKRKLTRDTVKSREVSFRKCSDGLTHTFLIIQTQCMEATSI